MLVDAETLAQRPASSDVIPRVRASPRPGQARAVRVDRRAELAASASRARGVGRSLRELRRARRGGGEIGCTIAAAGSHPTDVPSEQAIADEPHYRRRSSSTPGRPHAARACKACTSMSACPTPSRACACSTTSSRGCRSFSRSRRTPHGSRATRTGLLSKRAEILGLLPRHGAPPHFDVVGGLGAAVRTLLRLGRRRQLHGVALGRAAASALRDARGADAGPADGRHAKRRASWSWSGRCCVGARAAPARADPADAAVYDQNRWAALALRPAAAADPSRPRRDAASARATFTRSSSERSGAEPRRPSVCEAEAQLAFDDPRDATADVVRRSLA